VGRHHAERQTLASLYSAGQPLLERGFRNALLAARLELSESSPPDERDEPGSGDNRPRRPKTPCTTPGSVIECTTHSATLRRLCRTRARRSDLDPSQANVVRGFAAGLRGNGIRVTGRNRPRRASSEPTSRLSIRVVAPFAQSISAAVRTRRYVFHLWTARTPTARAVNGRAAAENTASATSTPTLLPRTAESYRDRRHPPATRGFHARGLRGVHRRRDSVLLSSNSLTRRPAGEAFSVPELRDNSSHSRRVGEKTAGGWPLAVQSRLRSRWARRPTWADGTRLGADPALENCSRVYDRSPTRRRCSSGSA
jgi:hypothetical protein